MTQIHYLVYAGPPTCIRNDWYKTQNCQKFNGQTAKVTGPSRILKLLVSGQEGDLNGPACMHATHYACAHAHANTHKHEGVIISQSSEDIISENKRAYKNDKRNTSSTHSIGWFYWQPYLKILQTSGCDTSVPNAPVTNKRLSQR